MKSEYDQILIDKGRAFLGSSPFDGEIYKTWRQRRLDFLCKIFPQINSGLSSEMSVIEFGAAFGAVAISLSDKVATISVCEGRDVNYEKLKARVAQYPQITPYQLDNDTNWEHFCGRYEYDLAIHWGLLYHLSNWQRDLRLACRCARALCLETEVVDSSDPSCEIWRYESGADQALHGVGTIPAWGAIEQIFHEEGMSFRRFDAPELNTDIYKYDWESTDSGRAAENMSGGLRRFYLAKSLAEIEG